MDKALILTLIVVLGLIPFYPQSPTAPHAVMSAPSLGGAKTVVQSCATGNGSGGINSTSCTFSSSVGGGHAIVVVTGYDGTTAPTISDGTNTYSNATNSTWNGAASRMDITYSCGVTGGSAYTVTATFGGSYAFSVIYAKEISNTLSSGCLDQTATAFTASANSANPLVGNSLTTLVANEYVLEAASQNSASGTLVSASPWTAGGANANNSYVDQYQLPTATASFSSKFTNTSTFSNAVVLGASFK